MMVACSEDLVDAHVSKSLILRQLVISEARRSALAPQVRAALIGWLAHPRVRLLAASCIRGDARLLLIEACRHFVGGMTAPLHQGRHASPPRTVGIRGVRFASASTCPGKHLNSEPSPSAACGLARELPCASMSRRRRQINPNASYNEWPHTDPSRWLHGGRPLRRQTKKAHLGA
jgi:hypothetical protein